MFEAILGVNPAWRFVGQHVKARHAIQDSPLAEVDGSCRRGEVGYCEDFSDPDNLLFVDFGRGAIAVAPEEIRLA